MSIRCRRSMGLALAALATSAAAPLASAQLGLTPIGTYATGLYDQSAAEIPAYDPLTQRLFVVNATQGVDVLDLSNPYSPSLLFQISAPGTNSVAVKNGLLAVAVQATTKTDPGSVLFYNTALTSGSPALKTVTVGALPDMLTFTPDGNRVLVANEAEPNDDYTIDPEGSVSIINLTGGVASATVSTAGFTGVPLVGPVRVFGPGASTAQDLEPEYIAVSPDGGKALVTIQEGNAVAELDIATGLFTQVKSLGFKDHSTSGNGLDANRRNNAALIENLPIKGMFQPDAIASYEVAGNTYYVIANEGDARDYDGFSEETSLGDLANGVGLDTSVFDPAFIARAKATSGSTRLSDLTITSTLGNTDADPQFEEIYSFGARSFSILDSAGNMIYDSGDDFEQFLATAPGILFNASNTNNTIDNRSDDKGPEPEAVALGTIDGTPYAFVGLERVGGIMVYDITDPMAPVFIEYLNNRDFTQATSTAAALDLGPEGMIFIDAADSPTGFALLVVANEVSGTTTIYAVPEPATIALGLGLLAPALLTRRPNPKP